MSDKRFGEALMDVLRVVQRDRARPSIRAFTIGMPEFSYETIFKMAQGERKVTPEAIEAVTRRLNELYGIDLEPSYFIEYQIHLALKMVEERLWSGDLTLKHLEILLRTFERNPLPRADQDSPE